MLEGSPSSDACVKKPAELQSQSRNRGPAGPGCDLAYYLRTTPYPVSSFSVSSSSTRQRHYIIDSMLLCATVLLRQ